MVVFLVYDMYTTLVVKTEIIKSIKNCKNFKSCLDL